MMRRVASLALVLALSGCGATGSASRAPTSARPSHRALVAWYDAHASVLKAVSDDLAAAANAAGAQDRIALGDACSNLNDDIIEAQAIPVVPDPAIEVHWNAALDSLGHGAELCIEGADSADSAKLHASTAAVTDGGRELVTVARLLTAAR